MFERLKNMKWIILYCKPNIKNANVFGNIQKWNVFCKHPLLILKRKNKYFLYTFTTDQFTYYKGEKLKNFLISSKNFNNKQVTQYLYRYGLCLTEHEFQNYFLPDIERTRTQKSEIEQYTSENFEALNNTVNLIDQELTQLSNDISYIDKVTNHYLAYHEYYGIFFNLLKIQ